MPRTRDRPIVSVQTQMQINFRLFRQLYFLDADRISPCWGALVRLRLSTGLTLLLLFRNAFVPSLDGPLKSETHLTYEGGWRYKILTAVGLPLDIIDGTGRLRGRERDGLYFWEAVFFVWTLGCFRQYELK